MEKSNYLTTKFERAAYMLYFGGQFIIYMTMQLIMYVFYVSHLKLNPLVVASIMFFTRTFDAINDPIVGFLIDKFRLKGAKYKKYVNFSSVALPLSILLIFAVPTGLSTGITIALVIITYFIHDILYTISDVPILAISMTMTASEEERTKLLALSRVGAIFGVVGMGIIGVFQRGGNDNINWVAMAAILSAVCMALMIPQRWFLKERHDIRVRREHTKTKDLVAAIVKNDQFLIIMLLYLSQVFLNAYNGFIAYVAEGYYGKSELGSVGSVFAVAMLVLLALFAPRIVKRIGKNRFMVIGGALSIIGGVMMYFLKPNIGYGALAAMVVFGTGAVVPTLLRPMYTADCIEYGEHKTGKRAEATAFSVQTFFNKMSDSLGLALGGLLMSKAMFDEELSIVANSFETYEMLHRFSAVLPILMGVCYIVGITLFYKLNETKIDKMIKENALRKH